MENGVDGRREDANESCNQKRTDHSNSTDIMHHKDIEETKKKDRVHKDKEIEEVPIGTTSSQQTLFFCNVREDGSPDLE